MPSYCVCFVEVTPLFLGLQSMADDQVPCHQGFLQQPILLGKISQWLLQLSQYDLRMGTPRAMKSQAIVDLLAQFLGEEEFSLDDEVPGEITMAEEVRE